MHVYASEAAASASVIPYILVPERLPAEQVREFRETYLREVDHWDIDTHTDYGMRGNWELLNTTLEVHAKDMREQEEQEDKQLVQPMEGLDMEGRAPKYDQLVQQMEGHT